MKPSRRWVLAASVAALAACSSAGAGPTVVTLDEFDVAVTGDPGEGPLEVENAGKFGHTLLVTDDAGDVVAATDVVEPGASASLEVGLEPGEYHFTCRIVVETPGGEIVDHYARGMDLAVSVG